MNSVLYSKFLAFPLLAGLLVAALASASPEETFTLHADKMSFRCTSSLGELLVGKIRAEDVVIENLTIYDGYTTFSSHAEIPESVMHITLLQVLGLTITHFEDLIPLLLGKTVEWEDVTIEVKRMEASSVEYVFLEVWA